MKKYREAIIEENKIRCPICGATNGMITGRETIRNYKIRCKSSRRNHEHFFMLNVEPKKEKKE